MGGRGLTLGPGFDRILVFKSQGYIVPPPPDPPLNTLHDYIGPYGPVRIWNTDDICTEHKRFIIILIVMLQFNMKLVEQRLQLLM